MIAPLQFAPTAEQFIDLTGRFVMAWLQKYWWAVVIVLVFWYTRWYRVVIGARGREGGQSALIAARATFAHGAELLTVSITRTVAWGMIAVGGILWLLKSFGTLTFGVAALDPVSLANVAAILASVGAGLGIDRITFGVAVGAFLSVLFVAVFLKMAARQAEEEVGD